MWEGREKLVYNIRNLGQSVSSTGKRDSMLEQGFLQETLYLRPRRQREQPPLLLGSGFED